MTFAPPTVTNPTHCTDAQWLYALNPSVSLPSNMQVGFDTSANSVFWGTSDGTSLGYDASYTYGLVNIQVDAMLQDSSFTKQTNAFTFTLNIDCCAPPTVITAPTVPAATYTYNIGDALTVNLSSAWAVLPLGTNTCCDAALTTSVPVIVSDPGGVAPPAGLFTFQNNNL